MDKEAYKHAIRQSPLTFLQLPRIRSQIPFLALNGCNLFIGSKISLNFAPTMVYKCVNTLLFQTIQEDMVHKTVRGYNTTS